MNYKRLDEHSPLHVTYTYADRPKKYSTGVFYRHRIKVRESGVYRPNGEPYILVTCSVKKWDEKKFIKALGDLEGTIIRMGHEDYPAWCEKWMTEENPDT